MGKNRHDRHGGKIKGDTPDLTCDGHGFEISYHATLGHKHFLSCDIGTQALHLGPVYTPSIVTGEQPSLIYT